VTVGTLKAGLVTRIPDGWTTSTVLHLHLRTMLCHEHLVVITLSLHLLLHHNRLLMHPCFCHWLGCSLVLLLVLTSSFYADNLLWWFAHSYTRPAFVPYLCSYTCGRYIFPCLDNISIAAPMPALVCFRTCSKSLRNWSVICFIGK
jgi:hypothetical protein